MAAFDAFLDPHEEIDWIIPCANFLEDSEEIDSYTLSLTAAAAALGLTIMSGSGRDHALAESNQSIELWLEIDDAYKTNAAFDGAGTELALDLNIVTNSSPARTRDLTVYVLVKQRILQ